MCVTRAEGKEGGGGKKEEKKGKKNGDGGEGGTKQVFAEFAIDLLWHREARKGGNKTDNHKEEAVSIC